MASDKFLRELKELGATDSDIKQLNQLKNKMEGNDLYDKIGKMNEKLMGERVRPLTLSYETAVRLLKYNVYSNVKAIISSYNSAILLVEQGTTAEYEDYLQKFSEELQDAGIHNAITANLRKANLENIEFWYSKYKEYENMGNGQGMSYAREQIISIIEAG